MQERCREMQLSGSGLFDGEDLVRRHIDKLLKLATGPADLNFFDESVWAEAEMNTGIAGTGIADGSRGFVPLGVAVGSCDADLCAESHAIAARTDEPEEKPVVAGRADISKKLDWLVEAGDDRVNVAGVEYVAESYAAVRAGNLEGGAGIGTDILELAVAEIAKDGVGFRVGLRGNGLLHVVHDVGAGDEEVLPPVVIEIKSAVAPAGHAIRELAESAGNRGVGKHAATLVDVEGEVLVFDSSVPDVGSAVVVDVAEVCAHAGENIAVGRVGDPRRNSNFFELFSVNVAEEKVWHGVVGDKSIRKWVVTEVSKSDCHTFAQESVNADFVRHVSKRAIAVVAVERVVQGQVFVRVAVGAETFFERTVRVLVDFPVAVVDDEKIEEAVIVVVEPACTYGPHLLAVSMRSGDPGFGSDISKRPVAIIEEELVVRDVGNEDVGMPIVVAVADRDADAVARPGDAGLFGYVSKGAVMVVAEEAVPVFRRGFLKRRYLCAIDAVDVEKAVVVVVEQRDAGDHGFGLILVWGGAVARYEVKARLLRDLFKSDARKVCGCARQSWLRPETPRGECRCDDAAHDLEKAAALETGVGIALHVRMRTCSSLKRSGSPAFHRRLRASRQPTWSPPLSTVIAAGRVNSQTSLIRQRNGYQHSKQPKARGLRDFRRKRENAR